MNEKKENPVYKPQNNFEIMFVNGTMMASHWINTDYDLLDAYKSYLLNGKGYLIWENGVIDCSKIVGIMKR